MRRGRAEPVDHRPATGGKRDCLERARGELAVRRLAISALGESAQAISTEPDDIDTVADGAAALFRLRERQVAFAEASASIDCP